jgi:para-nitrobenzyl esterase
VFNEYPLPPVAALSDRFISAARQKPIFIGYTKNEETAFRHMDPAEEAAKYFHELFQGASTKLHRQMAEALGYEPPLYEVQWYPEGNNNLLATHCIDMPFLLGDWSTWRDAPMLQGTDAQRVVETVGVDVKKLWVAFAEGENLENRKFIIDENFRFVK